MRGVAVLIYYQRYRICVEEKLNTVVTMGEEFKFVLKDISNYTTFLIYDFVVEVVVGDQVNLRSLKWPFSSVQQKTKITEMKL